MRIGCCKDKGSNEPRRLRIDQCEIGQVYRFGSSLRFCVQAGDRKHMISVKSGLSRGNTSASGSAMYILEPDAYIGGLNDD